MKGSLGGIIGNHFQILYIMKGEFESLMDGFAIVYRLLTNKGKII